MHVIRATIVAFTYNRKFFLLTSGAKGIYIIIKKYIIQAKFFTLLPVKNKQITTSM